MQGRHGPHVTVMRLRHGRPLRPASAWEALPEALLSLDAAPTHLDRVSFFSAR